MFTHIGLRHGMARKSPFAHAWGVLCGLHLTPKGRRSFPAPFLPSTTALGTSWDLEVGHGKGGGQGAERDGRGQHAAGPEVGGGARNAGEPQP